MAGKRKRQSPAREPSTGETDQSFYDGPLWDIKYPRVNAGKPLPKAEQALSKIANEQVSPFSANNQPPDALDIHYVVTPNKEWSSMRKYSNFVIANEGYSNKEYVWVRPSEGDTSMIRGDGAAADERLQYWVGKVLEVRAKDPSHVYARIFWLYWPEQLPRVKDQGVTAAGRRDYHGKYELIASNHMEILDVSSFAGKAPVQQWLEEDEEDVQMNLYWRQTYDHRDGGKLSTLRKHCECDQYYNPDRKMLACSNEQCKIWLHAECLVDDVLTKTYERLVLGNNGVSVNGSEQNGGSTNALNVKNGKNRRKSAPKKKLYEGLFSAQLLDMENDKAPRIEITDLRPDADPEDKKIWVEDVKCLKCGTTII